MPAKRGWSKSGRGGGAARWLSLASAAGVTFAAAAAGAQASSECYFDNMRMVDAQPLMGQKESTNEVTGALHYLLHLPAGHDPAKKWPVIVFMHGIGEVDNANQGANLNGLTKHSLPRMVEDPMFDYPFIVISPQIPDNGWINYATEVGAALDRVIAEFGGDPNRLYLTGLSYGGAGTFSVGIALSTRIAALMPVTPGGSVDNWAMRSQIASIPTFLIIGTQDNAYQANSTRITELEGSGAETFFKYTYAKTDEYNDAVPPEVLTHKNVFGSYTDIGHDVWHAAYGVYCPTLDAQKTVQYDWLLQQSKDGSPFVDPRDPGAGVGGMGGMPAGGAAGSAGGGGMSSAGSVAGGAGGAPSMMGSAGSSVVAPMGGSAPNGGLVPMGNAASDDSGSCAVAAPASHGRSGGALLLTLAAAALGRARRRRA